MRSSDYVCFNKVMGSKDGGIGFTIRYQNRITVSLGRNDMRQSRECGNWVQGSSHN